MGLESSNREEKFARMREKLSEWVDEFGEFLSDTKSYIYDILKGEALERSSGHVNNTDAKAMGHIEAHGIIALESVQLGEDALNDICSMGPELIPVMEKDKKTKAVRWVTSLEKAKALSIEEQLPIIEIAGKYFFKYPGYKIEDKTLTEFVANFYRATGSRQGETKGQTLTALGSIQSPPMFPAQQPFSSSWGSPNEKTDDED